jgi:hypothetical protein
VWRAARAAAQEVSRRHSGEPLSMELLHGFRGTVLGAAVQRLGSRDEAFALLGQGQLVKNRNHHRALRRELGRVRELLQALGGEVHVELAAMLEGLDEPGNKF